MPDQQTNAEPVGQACGEESSERSKPSAPSELTALALSSGVEPYSDVAGIARLGGAVGTDTLLPWAIRSRQTEALLANLYYSIHRVPIAKKDIQKTVLVLEGMALQNTQQDPDLADAIEQEPILTTLLALLRERKNWTGTASELLVTLRQLAWGNGIDIYNHQSWPKDAARLSARLTKLTKWIDKAGIIYKRERTSRERKHIFEWLHQHVSNDSTPSPASSISSCDNLPQDNTLQDDDIDDAVLQLLCTIDAKEKSE